MDTLQQPNVLAMPFANSGTKNTIPTSPTGTNKASLSEGFPQVTSESIIEGGIPPERADFNGILNLTTSQYCYLQNGGGFTFSSDVSSAIGGYPLNALLWYYPANSTPCLVRSTKGNNTDNFTTNPAYIGQINSGASWEIVPQQDSYYPPLFSCQWLDYDLDSLSWTKSDGEWKDGNIYDLAYNHLVDDIDGITSETETIGSYTVTFYRATDGHKIVLANQETTVANIYSETGVAWYYVLDTTNERFKLPRTKFGFTGLRTNAGDFVEAGLPNLEGWFQGAGYDNTDCDGTLFSVRGKGKDVKNEGDGDNTYNFDASRSNDIYGNSDTVQENATEMYLFFYLGNFEATIGQPIEPVITELQRQINLKADISNTVTTDTAQTITGQKTVSSAIRRSSTIDQSATTGSKEVRFLDELDSENQSLAYWQAGRSTTTNTSSQRINNKNVSGANWASLNVSANDAGQAWASINCGSGLSNRSVNEATTSQSSTIIATMGWVNNPNYSQNVMHRTGAETATGNKTFSGTVSFTGTATATTQATSDSSTKLATTAFVSNKFQVVSALPATPDANTFYFIEE